MACTFSDIFKIILAIILPPLGVFLEVGCALSLFINIILTLIGWVPGIIHAIFIIFYYWRRPIELLDRVPILHETSKWKGYEGQRLKKVVRTGTSYRKGITISDFTLSLSDAFSKITPFILSVKSLLALVLFEINILRQTYLWDPIVSILRIDGTAESCRGSFLECFRQSWVGMTSSGNIFGGGTVF